MFRLGYSSKGEAIDGREHQAHEEADEHEGRNQQPSASLSNYDYDCHKRGEHSSGKQELCRADPFHKPGVDESRQAEADYRYQIDGAGLGFEHSQFLHHYSYGKAPDSNLRAYIEELGHHSVAVEPVPEEASEGSDDSALAVAIPSRRHLYEEYCHENGNEHEAERGVGAADGIETYILEYEIFAHKDSDDGTYRVEALGYVKASCRCLRRAHAEYIRVGGGLEHAAASGHYVYRHKVESVTGCVGCRKEEYRSSRIEQQSEYDSGLEAVAAYEYCSRQRKAEVASVEGELDEAGLGVAHIHNPLEGCQQGVCHIVGQAPQQKE